MSNLQPCIALQPSSCVLVVEDDDILRLLTMEVVLELGLPVVGFTNADEAMAYISGGGAAGLVITDHSMPGQLTGGELAMLLVQQRPGLPVILTSGYGYAAEQAAPGVTFLPKPWSVELLATLVLSLLGACAASA
ncbi:response regulator [Pseudomonas typographi]|uniref:Response regulator n=1 Tax=Pseudomonas typographi TaxID=2715964 RepID=A0ABR7Z1R0_9PSED|nr:response regulator [Pseudomonas typographi]MBD1551654.1 response regulator [Pseudomonas typographi]MBD1587092.1 response regulator [Pseudomonas typographi]MBD1599328.1 response regulator [Pseudomonas typographi]